VRGFDQRAMCRNINDRCVEAGPNPRQDNSMIARTSPVGLPPVG